MLFRFEHFEKHPDSRTVTEEGISILVNELHPSNAYEPIDVI